MPAAAALVGLVVGSFLNVVVHRLPRKQSLVRPGSRCPSCEAPVKPYDNVPVISWLLLRGRCRSCGERIPARYPLIELTTAGLWAAVVAVEGADEDALAGLAMVTLLVPIAAIDLERRIIPNALVAPGAVAAVAIVAATDVDALPEHLIAGAAAGGFFLLAALAYPRGMGMGDVKLAGMLGLFLGKSIAPALLFALVAGVIGGIVAIVAQGGAQGRKTAIPFGPFLALGAVLALFFGADIVDWYSDNYL